MATCKDCIHNQVGCEYLPTDRDKDIWEYCRRGWADKIPDIEDRCVDFKRRTEDVETNWISVKDRLPETNGKYLVAHYSMQFKRYFLDLLYYDAQNKDEYFYYAEGYKLKVDYWMPLPELPKGCENDGNI